MRARCCPGAWHRPRPPSPDKFISSGGLGDWGLRSLHALAAPSLVTSLRGEELLNDPLLNKGTAFTRQERRALGLEALLPWQEETLELQVVRCWLAFEAMGSDLERFAYLQFLRERNLTLFHRFLAEHIESALPIVYTPTVGQAIQQFSQSYRSPSKGVYLAAPDQARMVDLLRQACDSFGQPELLLIGHPGHR
jgi:malate dehydrogenase (oxaloacetate-decarboxylating)